MTDQKTIKDEPFVQDPTRNHRQQHLQDPRDNLMYGLLDIGDTDAYGNQHHDHAAYEAAQIKLYKAQRHVTLETPDIF